MPIIATNGLSNEWSISMGVQRPTVFRSVRPNEDALRSYLMAFRKFISNDEPPFIRSIHNLCYTHITSDELKGHICNCQAGWKERVLQSGIKLNIDGRDILPEYIADLWINGHYFHDDLQKEEELRRYVPLNILFVHQQFLDFVVEATRVIGGTAYTIKIRDNAVSN
jgi:hypothetical protein